MDTKSIYDQLVHKRFSPRKFSDTEVEQSVINEIMESARYTQSCFNEQPWRFVYSNKDNPEAYQNMLSCLNEKNQGWARSAPVLLLVVAKKTFTENGKPNKHAWYDTGAAVGIMTLKATSLNVYMHQMAGFDGKKAQQQLKIPEDYDPVAMAALGYLGNETKPDKERRSLDDIAHQGQWGQ